MRTVPIRVVAVEILALLALFDVAQARADWPSSPTTNLPICAATALQSSPALAPDLSRGAFIVWQDGRGVSPNDIYAQHVLATGVVDPAWTSNGLPVCNATGAQLAPRAVTDGSGGVLVSWQDLRSGNLDVYVHHLRTDGTLDPAWPVNGRGVATAPGTQTGGTLFSDGAGGAVVYWIDCQSDTDAYAAHVLANGALDPSWPAGGAVVAAGPGQQGSGVAISDGKGGLFVAWRDTRNGPVPDIYAQHLRSDGTIAPGWSANGVAVCTADSAQYFPSLAVDGAGGIVVAWEDLRGGTTTDIYAQHVRANGTVDPAWPVNGRAVCLATFNQTRAKVLADASGGAFVAWIDTRGGSVPTLYAQHLLATGVLDPAWPASDLQFDPAFGNHVNLVLLPDGSGNALAVWDDASGGFDVYAQHILLNGTVDPAWPAGGLGVSTATGSQNANGAAMADGSGGLIVTWTDTRSNPTTSGDIYAQRVRASGQLGGTVVGVPQEPDARIQLESVRPNPSPGEALRVLFSGAAAPGTTLALLDVAGRVVAARELDALGSSSHEVRFGDLPRLAPGLYFVTLRSHSDVRASQILRVVVLR
jgi:hypothetical protein